MVFNAALTIQFFMRLDQDGANGAGPRDLTEAQMQRKMLEIVEGMGNAAHVALMGGSLVGRFGGWDDLAPSAAKYKIFQAVEAVADRLGTALAFLSAYSAYVDAKALLERGKTDEGVRRLFEAGFSMMMAGGYTVRQVARAQLVERGTFYREEWDGGKHNR